MRRALVGVALVAWAQLVLSAPPAAACSCEAKTDAVAFAGSDAVFTGRLVERVVERRGDPDVRSSTDRATHRFEVEAVYKGDVAAIQEIVSRDGGESCGLELPEGARAVVFATRASWAGMDPGPGQYWADLCNGTRLLEPSGAPVGFGGARVASPAPPTDTGVDLRPVLAASAVLALVVPALLGRR